MKFLVFSIICLYFYDINGKTVKHSLDEKDSLKKESFNSGHHRFQKNATEKHAQVTQSPGKTTLATTTEVYFSEIPDEVIVKYIDAITLLKFDNKGERMMGVSDKKCDNARVGLDFQRMNLCELMKIL